MDQKPNFISIIKTCLRGSRAKRIAQRDINKNAADIDIENAEGAILGFEVLFFFTSFDIRNGTF